MVHWFYNLFIYYFEKGGVINLLIFIVAMVILYIAFGRSIYFYKIGKTIPTELHFFNFVLGNEECHSLPTWMRQSFRSLSINMSQSRVSSRSFTNMYRELLLKEIPKIDSGLAIMGAFITIAPLLGLLGTVVGMVKTFRVITLYGMGNPNLLSEGISVSLITTQTGLLVAFPGLLMHNWLHNKRDKLVTTLINLGEFTRGKLNNAR